MVRLIRVCRRGFCRGGGEALPWRLVSDPSTLLPRYPLRAGGMTGGTVCEERRARQGLGHGDGALVLVFLAVVEIEGPRERCVAGSADKSSSLQDGSHALRRVNESPKGILP